MLCRRCGKIEKAPSSTRCEICILKSFSTRIYGSQDCWESLGELFVEQDYECRYTGIPLQLGVDASIDHRKPRCFGGTNDLENLQWVHLWINKMKYQLTEEEFLKKYDDFIQKQRIIINHN